ncbi:tetratricopeptide repeat protein [Halovivax ruber XH-70]|uniref:Tetratricopeptide repeat protein n=1 Tax=Halovivax ruber (strain DSM 18193 / JCM 13892 / XH-70) TaxID=797302 RepID=L0IAL0_HALRX|nr:tetratricopeptide repeat protein [Halovivax ruber]AGB14987.1 tetratricopeptide repeat protein [Halovivax ruber XH-70]
MTDDAGDDRHRFSEGAGFDDPYDEFDLDPPELDVDPGKVDPVDSRAIADLLDERQLTNEDIEAEEVLDVGLNYMQINRFEQATETFERAARFTEDDRLAQEAWTNKGVAHAELEEWDEAIGAYREALNIVEQTEIETTEDETSNTRSASEHAATAESNLAFALWEYGETAQALEHAERAVERDPRFGEGWYNRAFFLQERGLSDEALRCIDNAIRLGMRSSQVLEEKARILEDLGEHEEAERVADEAEERREEAEQQLIDDQQETRLDE